MKNRIYAFLGGAFFLGYGIYVAKQTTGTYYFPVWIFVIPVVAAGYLIAAAMGKTRPRPAGHARAAAATPPQRPGPVPPAPQYGPGPVAPQYGQVPSERPAAWPPQPPLHGSGRPYSPDF